MNDVLFYRHAFNGETLPPNEMKGVDFTRARFRGVAFRGLDLQTVKWPKNGEVIVLSDYKNTLDRALGHLANRHDPMSMSLRGVLESKKKWAGDKQTVGVISLLDLQEIGGQAAVDLFVQAAALPKPRSRMGWPEDGS